MKWLKKLLSKKPSPGRHRDANNNRRGRKEAVAQFFKTDEEKSIEQECLEIIALVENQQAE